MVHQRVYATLKKLVSSAWSHDMRLAELPQQLWITCHPRFSSIVQTDEYHWVPGGVVKRMDQCLPLILTSHTNVLLAECELVQCTKYTLVSVTTLASYTSNPQLMLIFHSNVSIINRFWHKSRTFLILDLFSLLIFL